MEKECCNIKFTEIEEGIRIDITGKNFKEVISRCCCTTDKSDSDCCPPKEEKK